MTRHVDLGLAAVVAMLGLFLARGAFQIPTGFGYDRIGPRTAPFLVAGGLLLLAGVLALSAARRLPEDDLKATVVATRWGSLGLLVAACALLLLLVRSTGFIVAGSLQFWMVAQAFFDRRPLRDALVAVVVSVVVYVAFSRGLGLALPVGLAESLF